MVAYLGIQEDCVVLLGEVLDVDVVGSMTMCCLLINGCFGALKSHA